MGEGQFFLFLGGGGRFLKLFLRAENEISALFPGKRAGTGRKINLRPFSRKKGGFFIFRLGGGRILPKAKIQKLLNHHTPAKTLFRPTCTSSSGEDPSDTKEKMCLQRTDKLACERREVFCFGRIHNNAGSYFIHIVAEEKNRSGATFTQMCPNT